CLLPYVVSWNGADIGMGDFDVIAEGAVEIYLQGADPCALLLASLKIFHPFLAATQQIASLIQLAAIAGPKYASFRCLTRCLLANRRANHGRQLSQLGRGHGQKSKIWAGRPLHSGSNFRNGCQ